MKRLKYMCISIAAALLVLCLAFAVACADADDDEDDLEIRYHKLLAEKARIQEELAESKAREEYYRNEQFTSSGNELDDDERARYQDIIRGRDEIISNLNAHYEEVIEKEKQELSERNASTTKNF